MHASATVLLNVGEYVGNGLGMSRERLGAPLAGQVEAHRKNFGEATDAAFARQRDVALRVEAGCVRLGVSESVATERTDTTVMKLTQLAIDVTTLRP
jgi:hypothetical protein